jgi:hypothetical protein
MQPHKINGAMMIAAFIMVIMLDIFMVRGMVAFYKDVSPYGFFRMKKAE